MFQTDNEPQWGGFSADYYSSYAIEGLIRSPLAWVKQRTGWQLADKQQLAYKFVHGSFFEANAESTYILLFAGVEALIPKAFRVKVLKDTLKHLREYLAGMDDVDPSIKDSVGKLLEYKENESIRYRGRTWVQLLGNETFDGKTPEQYFLDAYNTRNKLAHANINRPTPDQLEADIPELRRYLLALLDTEVFGQIMPIGW